MFQLGHSLVLNKVSTLDVFCQKPVGRARNGSLSSAEFGSIDWGYDCRTFNLSFWKGELVGVLDRHTFLCDQ